METNISTTPRMTQLFSSITNKEVGSSDIKMMIKYLNNHNDGNKVNKIIKNVKVVDERKTASKN